VNILFLTSSAPQIADDATSPFILTMAEDLQALGHRVTILAPHAPNIAREEIIRGVRFVRFKYAPESWQSLADGGSAMVTLKSNPLKALLIPLFVLGQAFALWRLLKSEPFDLIQSHWLLPQGLVGGLLARVFKVPHLAMVHGADVFGLQHRLLLWCKKKALACTKTLICNSSATATYVRALAPDIPLEIIPVGATPPKGAIALLTDRSGWLQPELLFVGRLFEGKGLRYLLLALPELPEARLRVFGDGPDRSALEALTHKRGIANRVTFEGNAPHEAVLNAMRQAHLFIAPCITLKGWREAQGNALAEAMLNGLPVIASDVGGIPDAIKHEQTGLLVPEQNAKALHDTIRRLLADQPFAQRLADAGRAHALAHFNRYESAKKLSVLYEAAVT
jgi:glycosyltransferase involved in cell wall biosynthesis